ncbi:MAG: hypothetical protein NC543_11400 [bacterium]|nr:hypothetical protein [bacterium]MCM1375872.1 hypothetical protein [Muribaculum sp.]
MDEKILKMLQDSEMLLVGIGEEFEEREYLRTQQDYESGAAYLGQMNRPDLLPLLSDRMAMSGGRAVEALKGLQRIIADMDFFLIATCQTDILKHAGFPEERTVSPCGTLRKKQCICGCEQSLTETGASEREDMFNAILDRKELTDILGRCPYCDGEMGFNNTYLEKYLENGYLENWSRYTGWLQRTLNRKLCILELGVNMDYPQIIRFPFEKVGYYNRKASFVRVNQRLYQLPPELHDKGISIAKNSVDWLHE